MIQQPTRLYSGFAGIFLLVQGISTLGFRLYPPSDHMFPARLALTRMVAPHSVLHIVTGIAALGILLWGGERGSLWFAAGFGFLYIGLGLTGMLAGQPASLELQPFDHPFRFLLGGLGLLAAGLSLYRSRSRKKASV